MTTERVLETCYDELAVDPLDDLLVVDYKTAHLQ
jgi:hypothetical protein